MPIQQIPGFWSYLGQGLDRGAQSFAEANRQRLAQEELDRQHQMDRLGLMANLFNSGAIDASALNQAGAAAGMNIGAQPNMQQRQRELLARKPLEIKIPGLGPMGSSVGVNVKGSDAATDDERTAAGLPTMAERQSKLINNQRGKQEIDATSQDMGLKAQEEFERKYGADATRFVSQAATGAGGEVTRGNVDRIAQMAFQAYVQARVNGRSPIPQPELDAAKAYFHKAAMDLYNAHEALRIKFTDATTFSPNQGADPTVRLAGQISARMNNINGQLKLMQDDMSFKVLQFKAAQGKPLTPEETAKVQQYNALQGELNNLNAAHAKLIEGGANAREVAASLVAGQSSVATPPPAPATPAAAAPTSGGKRTITQAQKAQAMRTLARDQWPDKFKDDRSVWDVVKNDVIVKD